MDRSLVIGAGRGADAPWWRGARGEWFVVVQILLVALVVAGPRSWPDWPSWTPAWKAVGSMSGALFLLIGVTLVVASLRALGTGRTALPAPLPGARLVTDGPYAFVRHPVYAGFGLAAFGWALSIHGWLTLGWAALLLAFFLVKLRHEEMRLLALHAGYADYRGRVPALFPFAAFLRPGRGLLAVSILLACLSVDQGLKHGLQAALEPGRQVEIAGRFAVLFVARNGGAFLSLGADLSDALRPLVLVGIPLLAMGGLFLFVVLGGAVDLGRAAALASVFGGGLSNLFDRLVHGHVVDYVYLALGGHRTGVFNLADIAIVSGVVWLLWSELRPDPPEPEGGAAD